MSPRRVDRRVMPPRVERNMHALDFDAALVNLLDLTLEVLGTPTGCLHVVDERSGRAILRVARGLDAAMRSALVLHARAAIRKAVRTTARSARAGKRSKAGVLSTVLREEGGRVVGAISSMGVRSQLLSTQQAETLRLIGRAGAGMVGQKRPLDLHGPSDSDTPRANRFRVVAGNGAIKRTQSTAVPSQRQPATAGLREQRGTVLVIDDSSAASDAAISALRRTRYPLHLIRDLDQLFDTILELRPRLIMLDVARHRPLIRQIMEWTQHLEPKPLVAPFSGL